MFQMVLALLFSATGANQKALNYEEAFAKANRENKPLMILVGAKWCAACRIMKKETVQPMKDSGALNKVVVTYVDKDERPELSEQLMKGATLPQIVVFTKKSGSWKRYSLTGMQSPKRMNELLARATDAPTAQILR